MSDLIFRCLMLTAILFSVLVPIRFALPLLQATDPVASPVLTRILIAGVMASPLMAAVFIELFSRRALGLGFIVIHRAEEPRLYWFYISVHLAILLIAASVAFRLQL
ncbi:MAG: hypothetical protein ACK4UN_20605 [Limisphaerales bacterium]